jgi:hypothetical protein
VATAGIERLLLEAGHPSSDPSAALRLLGHAAIPSCAADSHALPPPPHCHSSPVVQFTIEAKPLCAGNLHCFARICQCGNDVLGDRNQRVRPPLSYRIMPDSGGVWVLAQACSTSGQQFYRSREARAL